MSEKLLRLGSPRGLEPAARPLSSSLTRIARSTKSPCLYDLLLETPPADIPPRHLYLLAPPGGQTRPATFRVLRASNEARGLGDSSPKPRAIESVLFKPALYVAESAPMRGLLLLSPFAAGFQGHVSHAVGKMGGGTTSPPQKVSAGRSAILGLTRSSRHTLLDDQSLSRGQ